MYIIPKVWAVVMKTSGRTWVDTLWVVEQSACDRSKQLEVRLTDAGLRETKTVACWVADLNIEDAKMEPNP